jgi:Ca2+/Na+ antiporter
MSARRKKEQKTNAASSKGRHAKQKKSDFTPDELRFFNRIWASRIGRRVLIVLGVVLLLLVFTLIARDDASLFLLLVGMALLLLIPAFWVYLLYNHKKEDNHSI